LGSETFLGHHFVDGHQTRSTANGHDLITLAVLTQRAFGWLKQVNVLLSLAKNIAFEACRWPLLSALATLLLAASAGEVNSNLDDSVVRL
jgi:hypothetical protein